MDTNSDGDLVPGRVHRTPPGSARPSESGEAMPYHVSRAAVPLATERRGGGVDRARYEAGMNAAALYTPDELEFLKAVDRYKRECHRPHPNCGEVLAVLRALGYRKVAAVGGKISDG